MKTLIGKGEEKVSSGISRAGSIIPNERDGAGTVLPRFRWILTGSRLRNRWKAILRERFPFFLTAVPSLEAKRSGERGSRGSGNGISNALPCDL